MRPLAACLAPALALLRRAAPPPDPYSYAHHGQNWNMGMCATRSRQSPINFGEFEAPWTCAPIAADVPPPLTPRHPCDSGPLHYSYEAVGGPIDGEPVHSAHAVAMSVAGSGVGGIWVDRVYHTLETLVVHAHGEHEFRGQTRALELHLMHTGKDRLGRMAAVAVTFEHPAVSGTDRFDVFDGPPTPGDAGHNAALQALLDRFDASNGAVPIVPLLNAALRGGTFFRYSGSLTVPPCTDTVEWFVRREPLEVSFRQAEALRRRDPSARVSFVGGGRLEASLVPAAGFPLHSAPAPALRRPLWHPSNLLLPLRLAWALARALAHLARARPAVVVGTGGYQAFPTCLAAALLRVPVALVEPNAAPGVANRALSHVADECFTAFPETARRLSRRARVTLSGCPVRRAVADVGALRARQPGGSARAAKVLVVGGSLGAPRLTEAAVGAVRLLGGSKLVLPSLKGEREWLVQVRAGGAGWTRARWGRRGAPRGARDGTVPARPPARRRGGAGRRRPGQRWRRRGRRRGCR